MFYYIFYFLFFLVYFLIKQLCALGNDKFMNIKSLTWTHPKYCTPWVAIVVNSIICGICVFLPFDFLVSMTNIYYCFITILVSLSIIILRYNDYGKSLHRPYVAAKTLFGLILIASGPVLVSIIVLVSSLVTSVWPVFFSLVSFGVLLLVYFLLRKYRPVDLVRPLN